MASRLNVREVDRGWKRLRRELTKSRGNPTVVVGVIGDKAAATHDDGGHLELVPSNRVVAPRMLKSWFGIASQ